MKKYVLKEPILAFQLCDPEDTWPEWAKGRFQKIISSGDFDPVSGTAIGFYLCNLGSQCRAFTPKTYIHRDFDGRDNMRTWSPDDFEKCFQEVE